VIFKKSKQNKRIE